MKRIERIQSGEFVQSVAYLIPDRDKRQDDSRLDRLAESGGWIEARQRQNLLDRRRHIGYRTV
jgi:hypothetical protein